MYEIDDGMIYEYVQPPYYFFHSLKFNQILLQLIIDIYNLKIISLERRTLHACQPLEVEIDTVLFQIISKWETLYARKKNNPFRVILLKYMKICIVCRACFLPENRITKEYFPLIREIDNFIHLEMRKRFSFLKFSNDPETYSYYYSNPLY